MKTLLLALFILSIYSFKTDNSKGYLKIGNSEYLINSASIANESYGISSKFEIDLIGKDVPKTLIYFSATSNSTYKLSDGIYKFSSTNLNDRRPFYFNGAVSVNNHTVKIDGGTFSIENNGEDLEIHFILKLSNGDIAKGIYHGKGLVINRNKSYN